ncbi:hypothetical protein V6Z11_D06G035500 [Gossypium hirsutum]
MECLRVTFFRFASTIMCLSFSTASSTSHSSALVSIITRRSVMTHCCSFIILFFSLTFLYSSRTLFRSSRVSTSSLSRASVYLNPRVPTLDNRRCKDKGKSSTASTGTLSPVGAIGEFSQTGEKEYPR